jgi:predicted secreted protein
VKASSGNQGTWPVYGNSPASASRLESWRGNAEIRLESKDFKAMAALITHLQETLQLKRVDFSVSPALRRSTEESMTADAIAAFRGRADAIRSAWGAKAYRLVQMDLGTAGAPQPYVPLMRAMKSAGAEAAPAQDFAGGETSLVVSVNGTVELQP